MSCLRRAVNKARRKHYAINFDLKRIKFFSVKDFAAFVERKKIKESGKALTQLRFYLISMFARLLIHSRFDLKIYREVSKSKLES